MVRRFVRAKSPFNWTRCRRRLNHFGHILFCARKYQEALTYQQREVELEPRNAEAYFRLGDLYVQLGNYDQALAAFEKVGELTPEFESFRAGIARVYALTGRQSEARHAIKGLKADPMSLAAVYVALGDKDEAIMTLEQAAKERSPTLVALKVAPLFDSLHSEPRMEALLSRLNFVTE
jgi:tetratricopeptide (TPR) repeat protein